jgi:hypothetical protein
MSDLFASHCGKHSTILLIDASGSVVINKFNDILIFDQIKKIIGGLDEIEYRIIFWNSDKNTQQSFTKGVYKLPFVVKKSTLDQIFTFIKQYINNNCLTFPHLAFDNISDEWINDVNFTKIYFITDGEMGYGDISVYEKNSLKTALSESIKRLFNKHNNVQLNIVTIEPKVMDFTQIETLQKAAGCDVYNVIMDNHLTKYITKFVSYTPNNMEGFLHINKNIPPSGFVPFGDKYFSELRTNEFIKYLAELILKTNNENELLQLVQYLSSTVCTLTKDKPKRMVYDIVRTFCGLFTNTPLDIMFVQFILSDAVEKENAGMANIFATYRAQLRDLYKQANNLLQQNVKDAIGVGETFLTLPIDNKLISGHFRLVDKNVTIEKTIYPQSCISVNDILLPIIPFDYNNNSLMNEQCLRQWTRILVHKLYAVNAMEDIVIYIVLLIVLKVCLSDVSESVKNSYRKLGTIMLKKKRMNTDITELSRLENGELPIPNSGKIEGFYEFMDTINKKLGTNFQPMTLWYAMCLALNNENLITKQLIHCKDSIEKDFSGIDPKSLLLNLKSLVANISYHEIPFENVLDYNCLITLEDTSLVGGYRFLPHNNIMGIRCYPVYVLSTEGHKQLLSNNETCICPICYTHLNKSLLEKVDKKPLSLEELKIFTSDTKNIFGTDNTIHITKTQISMQNMISTNTFISNNVSYPNSLNKKGTLIIMKGTVGCGKSTYSSKIKEHIEKMGGTCLVVGTDKYCKLGMTVPDAISKIKEELLEINELENSKMLVVIIDTCGEKNTGNNIFDINFNDWKKVIFWPNLERSEMEGYLTWTLCNVLRRDKPTYNDNHYLNPTDAGVNTCINVHKKKASALFGNKIPNINYGPLTSRENVISKINDKAESYQKLLDSKFIIDNVIAKFIKNKILD